MLMGKEHEKNLRMVAAYESARRYYDEVYFRDAEERRRVPRHLRRLALKLGPWQRRRLLDVGCGIGHWLAAAARQGANVAGIDISQKAVHLCHRNLRQAELVCGPAETLPFDDRQFDFVSCLGSLEHFLDPEAALREMIRVAKVDARFLLLVPNDDFWPRRLGLYSGTNQMILREEVRTLSAWQELFESAGLRVISRWKDLHILSWSWIFRGPWYSWPIRGAQALVLPLWPLGWQYQIYHLCVRK